MPAKTVNKDLEKYITTTKFSDFGGCNYLVGYSSRLCCTLPVEEIMFHFGEAEEAYYDLHNYLILSVQDTEQFGRPRKMVRYSKLLCHTEQFDSFGEAIAHVRRHKQELDLQPTLSSQACTEYTF